MKTMLLALLISALIILPISSSSSSSSPPKRAGPPAHYVIRSSDLPTTLQFLTKVLHLRVLRHEENPTPCAITCNGEYAVPWSKTMVGTAPEDEAYALEVTYNYGIAGYERGTMLVGFGIYVDDLVDSIETAMELGYAVKGRVVTGPDGYRYRLEYRPEHKLDRRREPFHTVYFAVPDPEATADWYAETIGAVPVPVKNELGADRTIGFHPEATGQAATLGWKGEGVVFHFTTAVKTGGATGGTGAVVTQFDGRNALSLPAEQIRSIHKTLLEKQPERIAHELQELDEGNVGLGILLILIITDPNGLELCLVSSEAFEPAIRDAADFLGPDYDTRKKLAIEYAEAVAEAKKETPDTFGWAVVGNEHIDLSHMEL
mmetsp:Transcript_32951/g.38150  ORF Transcript_32951/g.38150 Transcript_32951/m.38150 type:complete len:374 (-) Transcript_32951:415-1536(-)